jgi:predicted DNA-binding protein
MNSQMIIRLDDKLKSKLNQLAKSENKNSSQVVRELIESYVVERDIETYIDDLWNRISKNVQRRKIGITDIQNAIRESRAANR